MPWFAGATRDDCRGVRMRLTVYACASAPVPIGEEDLPWPEAAQEITDLVLGTDPQTDKRDLIGWSPVRLKPGTSRLNENVEAITALVIDVDAITDTDLDRSLHAVRKAGWACLMYTTASDPNPDGTRRVRFVSPVDRDITKEECARTRAAYADALGLRHGVGPEACLEPARYVTAGRLEGTPERDVQVLDGAPVTVGMLLERPLPSAWDDVLERAEARHARDGKAAPAVTVALDRTGTERVEDMVLALTDAWPPAGTQGNRRELCRALGGYLARQGWSDDAIHECVSALPSDTPEARGRLAVEAAQQARAGRETAGWQILVGRLGQDVCAQVERASKSASLDAWIARREAAPPVRATRPAAATASEATTHHDPDRPLALTLDAKGKPLASAQNIRRVLDWIWPDDALAFEESAGRTVITDVRTLDGVKPGEWSDNHTTALVHEFDVLGMSVSYTDADRHVTWHASQHAYNELTRGALAARDAWDGKPRIDTAITTYWRGEDTPAHRTAARVFLLSLAARAIWPGCKVDTCPVFCDPMQGTSKSSALAILAGGADRFSDSPLSETPERAAASLRGKWIIELGEGAIMRKRDAEAMRVLLSAQFDHYRPAYGKRDVDVPRTVVFAMSTNKRDWSPSDVDERRYLPIALDGETRGAIDLDALRRDRVQLIGEAVARVLGQAGVEDGPPVSAAGCAVRKAEPWWPVPGEAEALRVARAVHTPEGDPWEDAIRTWLDKRAKSGKPVDVVTMAQVFAVDGPVPISTGTQDPRTPRRAASALRNLGYANTVVDGVRAWRR
jgi:hypothetical protein